MVCCCVNMDEQKAVEVVAMPAMRIEATTVAEEMMSAKASSPTSQGEEVYYVTIEKARAAKVGMEVAPAGPNLRVLRISPGLVQTWNEEHPESAVAIDDLVFEVNGVRGRAAGEDRRHIPLLKAIRDCSELKFALRRGK
mmetsp:Transcript_87147/g.251328  ORF Transcript_87147/g.251328 Transcript_87147/m.251328 type:complete len:139 (-) Transcript_87147:96-512(-)